ncbi:phosphate/phosphite/phosphonate ABC transporter substrate-binding protein [Guyparkeria sp. 1SP6A2]|nr:phosphate/phosphite/phosphonate ABC transporter substrate-binding protein [Guyparkeria sp. 1SP6A2]
MRSIGRRPALGLLLLALLLAGCGEDNQSDATTPTFRATPSEATAVYTFAVHPLHNPVRLHEVFNPLMTYLSAHLPEARFRLEASRNYAHYNRKIDAERPDFLLPNPYQTLRAQQRGYRVIAKMGDDHNFRGIILVRRDSEIDSVEDLRGGSISYPARTALAATMMPQYFLHQQGLDVSREVDNRYVGSQESAIMNVYLGETDAGATWPPPWRALSSERPELAEALEIRWQTDPLPNNSVMVHERIDDSLAQRVALLLDQLHERQEGDRILGPMELSRFELAADGDYASVVDFIGDFERAIGPIE